jgi:triosephosphate isomerase
LPTDAAPLGRPLLLLNLKAYPNCLGPGAERIGRILARRGAAASVPVALAAAAPDLGLLARRLRLPILAQHVDPDPAGAHTGAIVAESLVSAGVRGSLVNHSEHPVPDAVAAAAVARLREVGLPAVVCAPNVAAARRLARLRPPYLAVEPPELIGGNRSVSTARPEVIRDTVDAVRRVSPLTRVLCGAGVHDREDVRRALELGSEGILVASAVTRAEDPDAAVRELLQGYPTRRKR